VSESQQIEFAASISDQGGFIPRDPAVRQRLAKWKKYGELTVTVRRFRIPKSNDQLGYYHTGILPAFAEHIGDTAEAAHADLKRECLPRRRGVSKLTGAEFDNDTYSLADATLEEMTEFITRVIRLAASIGLPIPPPKGSPEWATWVAL
jgi:hypothetical protein